jgi:phosphinothricin acetyltransferase
MFAVVRLRPANADDAAAIMDIYNHEVLTSTVTFDLVPRTLEEQRHWITDRSGAHVVVVAEEQDGAIAGFGALSAYRERAGYATTVEDSIYLDRAHRGRGVGRALLEELVAVATAHGFHAMMAKIVAGHDASIALHRGAGFEVVGQEREVGRKFGKWLDVILMERLL